MYADHVGLMCLSASLRQRLSYSYVEVRTLIDRLIERWWLAILLICEGSRREVKRTTRRTDPPESLGDTAQGCKLLSSASRMFGIPILTQAVTLGGPILELPEVVRKTCRDFGEDSVHAQLCSQACQIFKLSLMTSKDQTNANFQTSGLEVRASTMRPRWLRIKHLPLVD